MQVGIFIVAILKQKSDLKKICWKDYCVKPRFLDFNKHEEVIFMNDGPKIAHT
jgi:hypothetical protein